MQQTKYSFISPEALRYFKHSITNEKVYLKIDSRFVFICGAKPNKLEPTGRDRLLEYAEKHIKDAQFFIAERFFEVFQNLSNKDLLSLEDKLTNYSDCIIIILESESTYAELGAFAIKDDLAKIILAINDSKYNNSLNPSFISLGPLAKINEKSLFSPVIYTDLKSILKQAPAIDQRLSNIKRVNRKGYKINSFHEYENINPKIKLMLIFDIIALFNPLTHQELIALLIIIYGENNYNLSIEIAMLKALGMIREYNKYYISNIDKKQLYFDYRGMNVTILRASVINHYHKYYKGKIEILKNKLKN
jgi:hypothetical protein